MSETHGDLDLRARKGRVFKRTITVYDTDGVTPLDLTGGTIFMQVREYDAESAPLILEASVGSGITIDADPATGKFVVLVTATVMDTKPVGDWAYDITICPSGDAALAFCLYAGKFTIENTATVLA